MRNENLLHNAAQVVEAARKLGANLAEAYVTNKKELFIDVREGSVETLKLAEEKGVGLRVLIEGRVGFAFSTKLDSDAQGQVAEQALANAYNTAPDENRAFPGTAPNYPRLEIFDPELNKVRVEEKINLAQEMESEARAYSGKIKTIENASYQDGVIEVAICNSLGVSLFDQASYCGVYISLVAGEGEDNQTGFALDFSLRFKDLKPQVVGKKAAEKAVRMLGARAVPSQKVPVIFDPYTATNLLGVLAPALTGEAVQKGRSLFAGKTGQPVASPQVNVIDDGTLPGGLGSFPFDGEGYPTSRTVLIENGILQGFLHNMYTARREGTISTGNGTRSSFKSTPEVGTTNFFLAPGTVSPSDLIKEINSGFYVTELMGVHTANPISGDFSLGASGLWIKNGSLAEPVRGVALAGNMVELLKSVDGVADDLQFFGGKGAPTLRVAAMSISGH